MRGSRKLGLAFAVAAGGVALGTVLGAAANPTMKDAPEPDRPAEPAPAYAFEGVSAYDLAPYPGGHAAPFPDEAITDWAPDYPAWTYSDFGSDFGDDPDAESAEPPAEPGPARPAPSEPLPPEPRLAGTLDAIY
jgi:hypothetical protein